MGREKEGRRSGGEARQLLLSKNVDKGRPSGCSFLHFGFFALRRRIAAPEAPRFAKPWQQGPRPIRRASSGRSGGEKPSSPGKQTRATALFPSQVSPFKKKKKRPNLDHRLERQAGQGRRPGRAQPAEGLELGGAGRVAGLSLEVHLIRRFWRFSRGRRGKGKERVAGERGVRETERDREREREGKKKSKQGTRSTLSLHYLPPPLAISSRQSLYFCRLLLPPSYTHHFSRCVCCSFSTRLASGRASGRQLWGRTRERERQGEPPSQFRRTRSTVRKKKPWLRLFSNRSPRASPALLVPFKLLNSHDLSIGGSLKETQRRTKESRARGGVAKRLSSATNCSLAAGTGQRRKTTSMQAERRGHGEMRSLNPLQRPLLLVNSEQRNFPRRLIRNLGPSTRQRAARAGDEKTLEAQIWEEQARLSHLNPSLSPLLQNKNYLRFSTAKMARSSVFAFIGVCLAVVAAGSNSVSGKEPKDELRNGDSRNFA